MLDPPDSVEVMEFRFKLKHKIRVFDNADLNSFYDPSNLVTSSSKYGLIFVCTSKYEIKVIPLGEIEKLNSIGEVRRFPYRRVIIPEPASHLNINCDNTLLSVTIRKSGSVNICIYSVESFFTSDIRLLQTVNIASSDIYVLDAGWNPAAPNIYSVCKSDGSLDIYDFKINGSVEKIQLPSESGSLCFCWSPKGKQIAVGSRNGNITQYKPDLKAVKVIAAPPLIGQIISLQWISNYQFIAIYTSLSTSENFLIVIDTPKTGSIVYTNYYDICYSHGNIRSKQFYINLLLDWNTLIVASSNSSEVGVLGILNNRWTQFNLTDAARADLPLSHNQQDTLPIGIVVDFTFNESSVPHLLILSNEGILSCYAVINAKETAKTLCYHQKPAPCSDLLFKLHETNEPVQQKETLHVVPSSNYQDSTEDKKSGSKINESIPTVAKITQYKISSDSLLLKELQSATIVSKTDSQSNIAKLIHEDCCHLELELNYLLYKDDCIQLITKGDSFDLLELERSTRLFVSEITELLRIQQIEVKLLKQSVIQSWAWYEDVKSRLTLYTNPRSTSLIRFHPLDIACERQLVDMHYHIYYIESQLGNGNQSLEEQWELFQLSCKETCALQLPNTEMIYRSMVKHSATLQRLAYVMKDISTRIHSCLLKQTVSNLWFSTKRFENIGIISNITTTDCLNIELVKLNHSKRKLHISKPWKLAELKGIIKSHNITYVSKLIPNIKDTGSQLTVITSPSPHETYPIKNDLSNKRKGGLTVKLSPKEGIIPSMSIDHQTYINLKRSHCFGENSTNSAFVSTLTARQHCTAAVLSQSEKLTTLTNTTSPFPTYPLRTFSVEWNAPSVVCNTDGIKILNKTVELDLKENIKHQRDPQKFKNECGSMTANDHTDISDVNGDIAGKGDGGAHLFLKNSTVFTQSPMRIVPSSVNNRSRSNAFHISEKQVNLPLKNVLPPEVQHVFVGDRKRHNGDQCKPKSGGTFVKDKDATVDNTVESPRVTLPCRGGADNLIKNANSSKNGITMLPLNVASPIFHFPKTTDTTFTSNILSSTLSTFATSQTPSYSSINKPQYNDNISFSATSTNPSNITSYSHTNLYLHDSSMKEISKAISFPMSGIITTSSCSNSSIISSNITNNSANTIFEFECVNTNSPVLGTGTMTLSSCNIFSTSQSFYPSSRYSLATSATSNALANSSIVGPISSVRENEVHKNDPFYNTIVSTSDANPRDLSTRNNVISDAQQVEFKFGSLKPEASTTRGSNFATFELNNSISTYPSRSANTTLFGEQHSKLNSAPTFGTSAGQDIETFGSAPIFGGLPDFRTPSLRSSSKVFGSTESATSSTAQQDSTFANLATQTLFGFGDLASTTSNTSAPTFTGGSSFTSWR